MRAECIQAVAKAIGRAVTVQEAQRIEQRIRESMQRVARQDVPAWQAMSRADRLRAAAQVAGQELIAEAGKRKQRVALTILAHDRLMTRYDDLVQQGAKPFGAVATILENVSAYAKGVSNEAFSRLIDTLAAVDAKYLGMVENSRQAADLVHEIFGRATGNSAAAKGAKAWLETVEGLRQRFNRAGGDIGKLDYGYLPQPHDQMRVLKAGQDQWSRDILPLLDRSRYLDENGVRLDDGEMLEFLGKAWETLSSGGINKIEPGKPHGSGMRANAGSDSRALHFADADAYLRYAADYHKGGVLAAMQAHLGKLSRDIALVENMGPNPEIQFRFLHDTATKTGASDLVGPLLSRTADMWHVLTGNAGHPVNVKLAELAQGWRNVEVFGKLQSAFLSSITDIPTYFTTTGFNRLGVVDSLVNLVRSFGGDTKDYANRAGLVAESLTSDMNRWAESNIGKGWTGKLANATMKASLLEAWTDAVRRGFSVTMMGALGKLSRGDWAKLDAGDRWRLEAKGVTAKDFAVWQLATPENWRGSQMLTASALRAIPDATLQANGLTVRDLDRAVSRLLGTIADESEYASVGQDLKTRAALTRGTQKGTIEGEFLRSLALFKGFPLAMISRHWGRVIDQWRHGDNASSVAYGAGMAVGVTLFGAIAMTLKDLASGKDPRDMTTAKFWGAAMSQGGGAGILGDMLYTGMGGNNRAGVPNWLTFAGPVFGSALEGLDATAGNVGRALQGKETHAGADLVRLARSHTPFVNLWYAKAALDHAVFHELQEYLSPGYQQRLRERAHADWNQSFWWSPGGGMPSRDPDFSRIAGGLYP